VSRRGAGPEHNPVGLHRQEEVRLAPRFHHNLIEGPRPEVVAFGDDGQATAVVGADGGFNRRRDVVAIHPDETPIVHDSAFPEMLLTASSTGRVAARGKRHLLADLVLDQ
jgi:hypothetical protein